MHRWDLSSPDSPQISPRTTLSRMKVQQPLSRPEHDNKVQYAWLLHATQAESDRRWQSRIKIRIRGSQHAGSGMGILGAQSTGAREEHRHPMQQEQAAGSSSHGLNSENVLSFRQRPDLVQGSQTAGSWSDKATSQLRLHAPAQSDSRSAGEALPGQTSTDRHEEGQESRSRVAVGSGSTAPSLSPAQGSAPSNTDPSDLDNLPPAETPQLDEAVPVQGAVSLAGAWNTVLSQARAPSVIATIPEEPTAAMLQYAAASAQLPPSGMTCKAWLAQADQHRCGSASHHIFMELISDSCDDF